MLQKCSFLVDADTLPVISNGSVSLRLLVTAGPQDVGLMDLQLPHGWTIVSRGDVTPNYPFDRARGRMFRLNGRFASAGAVAPSALFQSANQVILGYINQHGLELPWNVSTAVQVGLLADGSSRIRFEGSIESYDLEGPVDMQVSIVPAAYDAVWPLKGEVISVACGGKVACGPAFGKATLHYDVPMEIIQPASFEGVIGDQAYAQSNIALPEQAGWPRQILPVDWLEGGARFAADSLTFSAASFKLPIASAEILGGIRVGDGLIVDPDSGLLAAVQPVETAVSIWNEEEGQPVGSFKGDFVALDRNSDAPGKRFHIHRVGSIVYLWDEETGAADIWSCVTQTSMSLQIGSYDPETQDHVTCRLTLQYVSPTDPISITWDGGSRGSQLSAWTYVKQIPTANGSTPGIVKASTGTGSYGGCSISNGEIRVASATKTKLGVVRPGSGLKLTTDSELAVELGSASQALACISEAGELRTNVADLQFLGIDVDPSDPGKIRVITKASQRWYTGREVQTGIYEASLLQYGSASPYPSLDVLAPLDTLEVSWEDDTTGDLYSMPVNPNGLWTAARMLALFNLTGENTVAFNILKTAFSKRSTLTDAYVRIQRASFTGADGRGYRSFEAVIGWGKQH